MSQQGWWPRLAAEGLIIVASILLAFAVDASWDARQDRLRERSTLESLKSEFLENRRRLTKTREDHVALRDDALRLLGAIAAQGDPAGSYSVPDELVNRIAVTEDLDPVRGSLNAVLSSGDLLLIQDGDLRAALAAWPEDLRDLLDFEIEDRRWTLDIVVPILHEHVPFASIDYRNRQPLFEQPSRFEADYRGLLDSLPFENWVDFRIVRLTHTLREHDQRIAQVDAIVQLIDKALEQ